MGLKGRNFLKLLDYTPEEMTYLLDLAAAVSYTHLDVYKRQVLIRL